MGRMPAMLRYLHQRYALLLGPLRQSGLVAIPHVVAPVLDLAKGLQLSSEHGCQQVTGEIGGSLIHPGVFVDLSPPVARPVRTLFAQDLRASGVRVEVVDEERATLAHGNVLGVMETQRGQITEGAQVLSSVGGTQAVRGAFDEGQSVGPTDVH